MKKKWLVILLIVPLGVLAFFLNQNSIFNPQKRIKPKLGNVVESIYGLGTVTAFGVYNMRTVISLNVGKLYVTEGDLVKVGDPLVKLDDNLMRSPLKGTVTGVNFKEGELVSPHVPIITVTNLDDLHLDVSLEQQSVLRVQKGQKVFISFESLRGEKFEGSVKSIYPRENQFIVVIEIKKWPQGVLPGMTADVAIQVGKKEKVLLIPVNSIYAGQVIRVHNGKKEKISVKLGVVDGEWAEVTSENIAPNDELIVRK